jgi:DNA polymerase-3 subunit gamma/tau
VPNPAPQAAPPAEYTVVARRYRPQQFADLIGQEHVASALTNAIQSGRIAHAYLFTGARGTGKTSTARIVAKALNCETGPTATPCDQCRNCKEIMAGDDVDVLEIDGASNNGIEHIRELRQNVVFRPSHSRYKIYIIDEVHMLSTSAFNGLLKTLEEPPPQVKFLFATTEIHKIPITILSRCQRFDFASITPEKIFETLRHIVRKEGLQAEDEALHLVALRAAGSMRDSQTLLDQLLGFAQGNLTAALVRDLFGMAGDERLIALGTALLAGESGKGLTLAHEAFRQGIQPGELTDQLIEYYRGLMLATVGGESSLSHVVSAAYRQHLLQSVGVISLDAILAGLDLLATTKARLRSTTLGQVLVELAIVRLSRLSELLSVGELAAWLSQGGGSAPAGSPSPLPAAVPSASPAKKKGLIEAAAALVASVGSTAAPAPAAMPAAPAEIPFEKVWENVVQEMGAISARYLKVPNISIANSRPNELEIHFPYEYTTAFDHTRSEQNLELLRKLLHQQTGKRWDIKVALRQADDPAVPPSESPKVLRQNDLLKVPFFRNIVEVLGAQIVRFDPQFELTAPRREPAAPATLPDDPDEIVRDTTPEMTEEIDDVP